MKVLNLRCSRQHSFEGWFGSEQDFQDQLARGLIECPVCADGAIQKMPTAPRLNFGAHSLPDSAAAASASGGQMQSLPSTAAEPPDRSITSAAALPARTEPEEVQAAFRNALRQVLASAEDVGPRFAEEARRMHHGEAEARSIRGQASGQEALELLEEGIDVLPLPMLPGLKETLH